VWWQAGHDTPDALADDIIAEYHRREEALTVRHVAKLLAADVFVPHAALPSNMVS
jgi:hypothetical protein